jgi:hypothetical protein
MGQFLAIAMIFFGGFFFVGFVRISWDALRRGRVPCPVCHGDKAHTEIVGYKKDWDGASPYVLRDFPVYHTTKCPTCGGVGKIPRSLADNPEALETGFIALWRVLGISLLLLGSGVALMMYERR